MVSIITPTYNHEAFIGECISSVLAQSYEDWEQIIVDDGSTDRTWDLVAEFAKQDRRIRAVRQKNKGIWRLSETYNEALALAEGDLIAILEGDDLWPCDKLALQVAAHSIHDNVLMSYGKVLLVRDGETMGEAFGPPLEGCRSSEDVLKLALLCSVGCDPVGMLFSKKALDECGGFRQTTGVPTVDFPTLIQVLVRDGFVVRLDDVVGYYRQHGEQVTGSFGVELAEGRLQIALATFDTLPEEKRARAGLTRSDIVTAHRDLIADAYLGQLRQSLISADRATARRAAKSLWRWGGLKRKAEALCGVMAAHAGFTLEPILQAYEKLSPQGYR